MVPCMLGTPCLTPVDVPAAVSVLTSVSSLSVPVSGTDDVDAAGGSNPVLAIVVECAAAAAAGVVEDPGAIGGLVGVVVGNSDPDDSNVGREVIGAVVGNGDPEGSASYSVREMVGVVVVGNGDPVGPGVGGEAVGVHNGDPVGPGVGRTVVGDADAGAAVLVLGLVVEDRSQMPG